MTNWPIVEIPGEEERRPARPPRQRNVPNGYRDYGPSNPQPGTVKKWIESEGWIPLAAIIGVIIVGGGILMHITGNGAAYWGFWELIIRLVALGWAPIGTASWLFVFHCDRKYIPWLLVSWIVFAGAILLAIIF